MVQKHSYLTDKDCKIIAGSIGKKRKIESYLDNDETSKATERGNNIINSFKITLTWLYEIFNGIRDKLKCKSRFIVDALFIMAKYIYEEKEYELTNEEAYNAARNIMTAFGFNLATVSQEKIDAFNQAQGIDQALGNKA
ncbi:hypothetical protein H4219_003733 [Mycoemilia scoparia]|uniref:Uncharacterized protein n=1 Tax=Mycoemilia scoparia TaxID=417184 RepID=A0A9W8DSY0_9FUNG|nr:hypothetical protein H4219_003733 [Mycoemilia scoparia]